MKDYLLELTGAKDGVNAKLNAMREYLQAYVLRIMHDAGIFQRCAFVGGTALRFLYNLPRYSEDLDFSLVHKEGYSLVELMNKIKQELLLSGYRISISYHDQKAVHSAFIKFDDLMYEAKIATDSRQKFSVKVEIDTNPPGGGNLETKIINKYFPIAFLTYDIASLFSGKLCATLNRKYTKGRDFFDLGWYLSRWPDISPNFTLLANGLKQAGRAEERPEENNWRNFLWRVVENADWKTIHQDVLSFLENPADMDIFTKENLLKLIRK